MTSSQSTERINFLKSLSIYPKGVPIELSSFDDATRSKLIRFAKSEHPINSYKLEDTEYYGFRDYNDHPMSDVEFPAQFHTAFDHVLSQIYRLVHIERTPKYTIISSDVMGFIVKPHMTQRTILSHLSSIRYLFVIYKIDIDKMATFLANQLCNNIMKATEFLLLSLGDLRGAITMFNHIFHGNYLYIKVKAGPNENLDKILMLLKHHNFNGSCDFNSFYYNYTSAANRLEQRDLIAKEFNAPPRHRDTPLPLGDFNLGYLCDHDFIKEPEEIAKGQCSKDDLILRFSVRLLHNYQMYALQYTIQPFEFYRVIDMLLSSHITFIGHRNTIIFD